MNTKHIDVSIVIPVYNSEKYIHKTIESIIRQQNIIIEVVVVNDGSQDNSILIAEKILESCGVFYKIINQENSGLSAARNTGLDYVSGKYVAFIDSDDLISSDHIYNLKKLLDSNLMSACFSDYEFTYEMDRFGKVETKPVNPVLYKKRDILELFSKRKIKPHLCTFLFDTHFLRINNLLFNSILRFGEDNYFLWKLFSMLDSVIYFPAKSYKYLQRENSLMSSQKAHQVILFNKELLSLLNQFILQYPMFRESYLNGFARVSVASMRAFALQALDYRDFKKMRDGIYENFSSGDIDDFKMNKLIITDVFIKFIFSLTRRPFLFYFLTKFIDTFYKKH